MKLSTPIRILRAPGMTLNPIMQMLCARELTTRDLINPNNLIQIEPTLAHTRAPYTLTADAKLIQITIIPYTRRLTGIQHVG